MSDSGFDLVRQAVEDFYAAQLATTGRGGGIPTTLVRFIGQRVDRERPVEQRDGR